MFRNIKRASKRLLRIKSATGEQDDSDIYRCSVCCFICNKKNVVAKTYDAKRSSFSSGIDYEMTGSDVDNVVITAGCPLCGSFYSR